MVARTTRRDTEPRCGAAVPAGPHRCNISPPPRPLGEGSTAARFRGLEIGLATIPHALSLSLPPSLFSVEKPDAVKEPHKQLREWR